MKVTGESKVAVDEIKLAAAEKWDGIAGVFSNVKDMGIGQILGHYRSLWQVEESFRISKHDLRVRPVYHWTDKRIKAHVAIVFMSYCAIRYLQYRVKLQYESLSPEVLIRELNHVQTSLLIHTETAERYSMPSKLSPAVKKLYKIMEVRYREKPSRIR